MWWKCQSVSFIVNHFSDAGRSMNVQDIVGWSKIFKSLHICVKVSNYAMSGDKFPSHWIKRKSHIPIVAFNQIVCDNQLAAWCTAAQLLFPNVCQCPPVTTPTTANTCKCFVLMNLNNRLRFHTAHHTHPKKVLAVCWSDTNKEPMPKL